MTCSDAGPPINPCVGCETGSELEVSSSESKPKLHLKLDASAFEWLQNRLSISDFFLPEPPLNSFAGAHLMQGCIGQPSQRIRASAPYTNPAPMNNNMLHTQMSDVIGGQASSSNLISILLFTGAGFVYEDDAGIRCDGCPIYPCMRCAPANEFKGGQASGWIQASAPYTHSVPVKNNQQMARLRQTGVNFGSTYHPNGSYSNLSSAIENDNRVWVTASNFKCNSGLDSKQHTLSSLPAPHSIQGLIGGEASEQGIHDPSHNKQMMVKRKTALETTSSVAFTSLTTMVSTSPSCRSHLEQVLPP
ncbi:hypothetical protein V6N12_058769 [Hibiscus sabdariffa]|uniref:Uncharacterized protein n=1 Tax=Hibiscus sabdariffa TaxID=183260 RepID=A0ABR2ET36_9ROSI